MKLKTFFVGLVLATVIGLMVARVARAESPLGAMPRACAQNSVCSLAWLTVFGTATFNNVVINGTLTVDGGTTIAADAGIFNTLTVGNPSETVYPFIRFGSSSGVFVDIEDMSGNTYPSNCTINNTPTSLFAWIQCFTRTEAFADAGIAFSKSMYLGDSNANYDYVGFPNLFADAGTYNASGPKFEWGPYLNPVINDPDFLFVDSTGDKADAILGVRAGSNARDFEQFQIQPVAQQQSARF